MSGGGRECIERIYYRRQSAAGLCGLCQKGCPWNRKRRPSSYHVRETESCDKGDDNTDVYYTFDEPEFSDIVKENLKIFLQRINIECDTSDFSIVPLKGKKVVTRTMGQFVDGNIGIYKITGNLRLLEILYAAGIGTRRSAGHGKFEIIF